METALEAQARVIGPLIDKIRGTRGLRSAADLRADDDEGRADDHLAATERPS